MNRDRQYLEEKISTGAALSGFRNAVILLQGKRI